jgi:alginate O-acetyltransferase complex protein AlgJ
MMKEISSRLCAYVMLLILVSGAPFSILAVHSDKYVNNGQSRHGSFSLLNGEISSNFDRLYKAAFPLREFCVTLLNTLSYVAFNEARKGAIIGQDGWIYTDEEFVWNSESAATVESHLAGIIEVEKSLASRGIRLAVALLPQKSTIYPEHLGAVRVPGEQQQLYGYVRRRLSESTDIILPDIKAALLGGKSSHDMFLRIDTHWTVNGAGVAANAVAASIPVELHGVNAAFKRVAMPPDAHKGDLLKFVNLGRWDRLLPVRYEVIQPIGVANVEATVDDFLAAPEEEGASRPQTMLVGTSYSANPLWSFQPQLEIALGASIANGSEEGKGYAAPMTALLESNTDKLQGVKLVIWEIPIRYLVTGEAAPQ